MWVATSQCFTALLLLEFGGGGGASKPELCKFQQDTCFQQGHLSPSKQIEISDRKMQRKIKYSVWNSEKRNKWRSVTVKSTFGVPEMVRSKRHA